VPAAFACIRADTIANAPLCLAFFFSYVSASNFHESAENKLSDYGHDFSDCVRPVVSLKLRIMLPGRSTLENEAQGR